MSTFKFYFFLRKKNPENQAQPPFFKKKPILGEINIHTIEVDIHKYILSALTFLPSTNPLNLKMPFYGWFFILLFQFIHHLVVTLMFLTRYKSNMGFILLLAQN